MSNEKPDNMNYSDETSIRQRNDSVDPKTESAKALRAIGGSLKRMRRIVVQSRPGKWVEDHPFAALLAAVGVSVVVTTAVARSTERVNGATPCVSIRSRGFRWLTSAGRMLAINWLGENVFKPASAEFVETASAGSASATTE